ncbi:CEP76 [Acanthosepion pharaonis]|uniref:CEP76 n=1 Tax=Acanthosepion pharaonis TaxID=158019 RepID=A0A812ETC6_ACAPH|nr:CEP76 [Sepia pharaonis]
MAVPPEQVNEIKQIIQQHLSRETVQNKLKSLLPDLKVDQGVRDTKSALSRSDLVKHLKESGAIDSIINDIEQAKNNNCMKGDKVVISSDCEKKRKLTNMMDSLEFPVTGNSKLCFKVLGGRAFLDHLQQQAVKSSFTLHILFRGQRVRSRRVPCTCDPEFNEEFIFDFKKSQDGRLLETSLLSITDKLNLVLTRTDAFGTKFLVSTHLFEWRQVLTVDRLVTSIELMGAGKMPVGLLEVELYINPRPSKLLTRDIIDEQCKQELRFFRENERRFFVYASNWWQEFQEIRDDLKDRMVKIFAQDENGERRPVCSFVRPIRTNRLLNTPREAARFVGLIHVGKSESVGQGMVQEKWTSMHAFLCCNKGESMDHAVLLCSLLLGFGLDAYVCVGTKSKGDFHVWVITISCSGVFTFWESQTGDTYLHKPVHIGDLSHSKHPHPYPYRTVGCVFNHKSFYANIQPSDTVEVCDFVLNERTKWKPMSPDALCWLYDSPACPLWTPFCHLNRSPIDPINKSNILEAQLRHMITIQRQAEGLTTQWDDQLSYLLLSRLHYFENERITGNSSGTQEFKDALQKMMLDEQEFNGFPIQQKHLNMHLLFKESMKSSKCQQIIQCRGDNVRHAVSVCVFPYPEDVCATWTMYACIYHRVA